MARTSQVLFSIVAGLLVCRDSAARRPDITAETEEIIKNEGEPLDVVCSGDTKIFFIYPTSTDAIVTSDPEINEYEEEDGTYRYEFRRPHTVYGDTGWYGCADRPVEVTTDSYADPDITWVYVYVQSNTSLFVQADTLFSLREVIGGTAVIPCRPTSPNLTVNLLKDEMDVESSRLSFDPRIGFSLRRVVLTDSGYFKCTIERDGTDHEVNYHLHVLRKQTLNEPKILEDTLRHVTQGQTLYVNCTIDIDEDMQYVFNWSTPQQSSRITTRLYNSKYAPSVYRVTTELVVRNVTDEDQGYYICFIKTFNDFKKKSKYIEVHDPGNKFINLTTQDANRHYERRYNDKVQWVVDVNAYPLAHLKWLNPKGEEIVGNWMIPEKAKYAINTTHTSTILRINRLDVNDMGVYSIQATNYDKIEMLNFTLDVIAKPVVLLEKGDSYYTPKQTVDMRCYVAAYPEPNITCTFLKCPYYPSCQNSTTASLMVTKEHAMTTSFLFRARMITEMSGKLTCVACNTVGCDSATENIFVSDGNGGFGIIEPKGPVTAGDDFELICASSVYNYSNIFDWTNEDGTLIREDDRLTIVSDKTQFTYRSILRIKKVEKKDSKEYICTGRTTDNIMESMEYVLRVEDARAPVFTETNMNESEVTIDLNEGHETMILKCFVSGMPKPNITWYKDDTLLVNNEQYMFLSDHQVLHMKYFLEKDSGMYSCRIANRIGKLEARRQITIKGKELSKGLIISIVVVILILLALVVYFFVKVRREKVMRKVLMAAGLMHFEEGAVECLNPDLTVDDQAELLPYDKKWEFPRERLKLGKKLGSGAFGVVMKAEAQGICEEEGVTTVAVKMVRRTTDPTYVRALASELKIMVHLGKHLNVVNLLGACTKNISKRELLVIVEYCRFGNLHNYLLRHRDDFINQIDPATGKCDPVIGMDLLTRTVSVGSNSRIKYAALSFSRSLSANSGTDSVQYQGGGAMDSQGVTMTPDGCVLSNGSTQPGWRSNYRGDYKDYNLKPICTQDLLSWAFQVARGMEYLSHRKVLHGDLAARNILLAENNIVKICDFGLAKTMYKDDNYKKKGDGPLPIKWMAIESIRDRIFSTQSDIWSFGIVLWEFFTLAETPYPGMEAEKLYQKLIEGYRMEQPEYATSEVYAIMLQCWKAKPTLRPSFTELVQSIGDLLEDSVKAHYISLNAPYMDMNTIMLESGKNDYLTMLSAPDHTILSSPGHEYTNSPMVENSGDAAYLCMSPTSPLNESGIFSPRPHPERGHFEFPSPTSDSEDAIELSPMLKKEEEDPYLKPINVHERRAEFARKRQAMKDQPIDRPNDRDSGYCNTPRNLHLIDLNEKNRNPDRTEGNDKVDSVEKDFAPSIIRTQDNYVNMPQQKIDMRKDMPDGFSNPSYVMMSTREVDQTRV
ncbi:vascular endothelial growth factor receptor 1 isoform X1 [Hylaeus volcanicus]|uniref:vascular endothelial growth factor receptor 1 isoform X1 n=1 Tax=Hylaeus volcanicus TaxID=313075 RepID=UPI0023B865C9|nr:vascular endothelial growth factor receptor 1 isoform X1 [Hylaeus volcanicus]